MSSVETRRVIDSLAEVVRPQDLLVGDEVENRASAWGHSAPCSASAVVRPRTTAEVAEVLRLCHAADQPVVTQGGLTGLVQGSIATRDEIVLSLERMTAIEEVDSVTRTMTVQAGATLQSIQDAADEAGMKFGLDLGARSQCTIGGNVSTNAGGNNVIRYGMTRAQVLGLEAVLADGTVVSDLSKMLKNNAGYDLKHLFIGSEGTLGVVTRVVLRLHSKPRSVDTALVAVPSFEALQALLNLTRDELVDSLTAFEVLWEDFYRLVTTEPAKNKPPLEYGQPYYVIVESQGPDPESDRARFQKAMMDALERDIAYDSVIATSPAERQRIWDMRDDIEQLARLGPICTFDVSLSIPLMQSYVDEVHAGLSERFDSYEAVVFGHLGDGNLHLVVGVGDGSREARRGVESEVYGPLRSRSGSVSAEHGVGLEKQPYLTWTRGPNEIALMRSLKQAMDPKNLLNPGRVIPPLEEGPGAS